MATKAKAAPSKITFVYEGVNKKGARIKGETEALNEGLAKAELRRIGINPVSMKKKRVKRGASKKILGKDIAIFSRQLATMMTCLLYTSPSPRDRTRSRMPSSA